MKHIRKDYTCKYCDWPEHSGIHSIANPTPGNRTGYHDFIPRDYPDAPPDPTPEELAKRTRGTIPASEKEKREPNS